ncbi:MATE family efflux transporter [Paenibacillus sp. T1]|uniref:Probable multidrug resistance protein NorM n=2 Tax=Paenibacillus glycinis TaxID=2697035 RepID=A0ABW9XS89_9BACL|nr:MATE family efflux transporter [Paenibacillus glycinis]
MSTFFDMVMVGSLGAYAVSSIGITGQPLMIMNFILYSINTVMLTKISVTKGNNDANYIKLYVVNLTVLSVIISLLFTLLGYFFADEIMKAMGATPDIAKVSANFFKIIISCICVRAVSNAITGALRGIGETRTSMMIILISSASNIIFNYFLIYGHLGFPKMGVNGAGLATCLSYVVGLLLGMIRLFFLKRDSLLHFTLRDLFKIRLNLMKEIFSLSLPVIWERVAVRIGVLITAKFTISIGTISFASHTIVSNLLNFSFFIGTALTTATTTFVGESVGKNDSNLAKAYIKSALIIGIIASSVFTVAFLIFPRPLAQIYTGDSAVIDKCVIILGMVALLQPFQCTATILFGAFRGFGDFKSSAKITSIGIVLIRPALTFAFVYLFKMNLIGAWIAIIADEFFRFAMASLKYYKQYLFLNKRVKSHRANIGDNAINTDK